jgi:hypothetical protein
MGPEFEHDFGNHVWYRLEDMAGSASLGFGKRRIGHEEPAVRYRFAVQSGVKPAHPATDDASKVEPTHCHGGTAITELSRCDL